MCGIGGYVGLEPAEGLPVPRRMADQMAHRGADGEGFFAEGRIGLAHRRSP